MSKREKLYQHIVMRRGDANVSFSELCGIVKRLGFSCRIKGDHHIFWTDGVEEIINLQPKGTKAKPYQVAQVRNVVLKYRLTIGD
jgi:hypothetical protein